MIHANKRELNALYPNPLHHISSAKYEFLHEPFHSVVLGFTFVPVGFGVLGMLAKQPHKWELEIILTNLSLLKMRKD